MHKIKSTSEWSKKKSVDPRLLYDIMRGLKALCDTLSTLNFKKFKQNTSRILIRKAAGIYLLVILPSVVCLLIRLLPFSLKSMFLSFSSLLLCLLISSKSDASRYSSSWMISNARPYLREKKEDTFFQSSHIVRRPQKLFSHY